MEVEVEVVVVVVVVVVAATTMTAMRTSVATADVATVNKIAVMIITNK